MTKRRGRTAARNPCSSGRGRDQRVAQPGTGVEHAVERRAARRRGAGGVPHGPQHLAPALVPERAAEDTARHGTARDPHESAVFALDVEREHLVRLAPAERQLDDGGVAGAGRRHRPAGAQGTRMVTEAGKWSDAMRAGSSRWMRRLSRAIRPAMVGDANR